MHEASLANNADRVDRTCVERRSDASQWFRGCVDIVKSRPVRPAYRNEWLRRSVSMAGKSRIMK